MSTSCRFWTHFSVKVDSCKTQSVSGLILVSRNGLSGFSIDGGTPATIPAYDRHYEETYQRAGAHHGWKNRVLEAANGYGSYL